MLQTFLLRGRGMVDLSILSKSTHLRIGMVKRIKILLTLPFSLLVIIPRCTYIHFIFIKRCVHKAAKEISFVENKNYIPVASSNIREKISTVYKCFYLLTFVFFLKQGQKSILQECYRGHHQILRNTRQHYQHICFIGSNHMKI